MGTAPDFTLDVRDGAFGDDLCEWIRANGLDPSRTSILYVHRDGTIDALQRAPGYGPYRNAEGADAVGPLEMVTVPAKVPPTEAIIALAQTCSRVRQNRLERASAA